MVRVVAGVLRNEEGDYFVARRKGRAYNGCWETPGGKVDPGETDQEALIREWQEEFGVDIAGHVGPKVFETELSTVDLVRFQIAAYEVTGVDLPEPGDSHDKTAWTMPGLIFNLPESQLTPSLCLIVDAVENRDRRHRAHRAQPADVPVVWIGHTGEFHWDCPFCVHDCNVLLRHDDSRRAECSECGASWERPGRDQPWGRSGGPHVIGAR